MTRVITGYTASSMAFLWKPMGTICLCRRVPCTWRAREIVIGLKDIFDAFVSLRNETRRQFHNRSWDPLDMNPDAKNTGDPLDQNWTISRELWTPPKKSISGCLIADKCPCSLKGVKSPCGGHGTRGQRKTVHLSCCLATCENSLVCWC